MRKNKYLLSGLGALAALDARIICPHQIAID
jgi:hypothetical protein